MIKLHRFPFCLLLFFATYSAAQSESELIKEALNYYIEGTSYSYPEKIKKAFHPDCDMYLYNDADTLMVLSPERYASFFTRGVPGKFNGRVSEILALDIADDIAYAKIVVEIPSWRKRFYDLILLKKIEGQWKIIAKAASAEPLPQTDEQLRPQPEKEIILDKLNRPWSMAFLSETDVLIAEKDGQLLRVDLQTKERRAIKGAPTDVARAIRIDTAQYEPGVFFPSAHGKVLSYNAGWFQLLLDPDFKNNPYLYISYAAEDANRKSTTKVVRAKLEDNRLTEIQTLLLAAPYSDGLFHYGGGMIFGKDGKLYIAIGERNLYEHLNPLLPLSQDVADLRGKIFRINPDGSIPDDNPDFGPDAVKGLYATGIRATQGLTVHPDDGRIWFTDHGTIQGDELNILQPGANYGWPYQTSGKYRSRGYNPPIPEGIVFNAPVHFWDQTIAPTGLCFYTGNQFPMWKGDLIVPGLSKGSLWRVAIKEESVVGVEELLLDNRHRLRKAVMSPRGKLFLLSDEEDGKLILLKNDR